MLKRTGQRTVKGKKLKNLKGRNQVKKTENISQKSLAEKIKDASEGLFYISETDAKIEVFTGQIFESLSVATVLEQIGLAADTTVMEKPFDEFFARLTEVQDWFGEEETTTATKFAELKEILEKNLRDLKVLKFGNVQIDIYVVGLDSMNTLTGIKTKAVET